MKIFLGFVQDSPGAVFRLYMSVVLFLFALLSLTSVDLHSGCSVSEGIAGVILSTNWLYGFLSLVGSISLLFRHRLVGWKLGSWISDITAVFMFLLLSYEYLTSKPPIYAGGILAITSAIFLVGGLIYDRREGA